MSIRPSPVRARRQSLRSRYVTPPALGNGVTLRCNPQGSLALLQLPRLSGDGAYIGTVILI